MKSYCPTCEKVTDLEEISKEVSFTVRGEEIKLNRNVMHCYTCGDDFEDASSDNDPLPIVYAEYRKRKNYLTPQEISGFRKKYDLSQKELSDLVGIGTATLSRYENGSLQEESHDKLLQYVFRADNLKRLIKSSQNNLPMEKIQGILSKLDIEVVKNRLDYFYEDFVDKSIDSFSGNTKFNGEKLLNMVLFFCENAGEYPSKLNKLLFYSDFLSYKLNRISISGSRYAHASFGPVPNCYRTFYGFISDLDGPIMEKEVDFGEYIGCKYISVLAPDLSVFSEIERNILLRIRRHFFNYSAKRIEEESHKEAAWINTRDGQLIDYSLADQLQIS